MTPINSLTPAMMQNSSKAKKTPGVNVTRAPEQAPAMQSSQSKKLDKASISVTAESLGLKSLYTAAQNANKGIAYTQTIEQGLEKVESSLETIDRLAKLDEASLSDLDKASRNQQIQGAINKIQSTVETTQYNQDKVLAGGVSDLPIGESGEKVRVQVPDYSELTSSISQVAGAANLPTGFGESIEKVQESVSKAKDSTIDVRKQFMDSLSKRSQSDVLEKQDAEVLSMALFRGMKS